MFDPSKIRNIAIVAHIDHGKTTLLDALLKQSNIFREGENVPERMMDQHDQEKERGITIYAKQTSLYYKDFKINVIDTPGHADFSAEVERILTMVNAVLLLIDAKEGPMPQTRFVLKLALKQGLNPIVVVNKIDRKDANPEDALNKTFDLFVELGATDKQLDFPYIYASGFNGYAIKTPTDTPKDIQPMFELIVDKCPPPPGSLALPFLMHVSNLTYDEFLGRGACGKVLEGTVKVKDSLVHIDMHGHTHSIRVSKIEGYFGLKKIDLDIAGAGDIVILYGIDEINIGDTLCDPNHIVELPRIFISEPTVSVDIRPNSGPFASKEGKFVTMNKIKERLAKEKKANISLKIEEVTQKDEFMRVSGRGTLHLAILIEEMRREGFELLISKPEVILKTIDGIVNEPFEKVHIEIPERVTGTIIEDLSSSRKGQMQSLQTDEQGISHLEFLCPTRSMMGYRSEFLTKTSGLGILTSTFEVYGPHIGKIERRNRGVLISNCTGKANGYACFNIQERGSLFVKPQDPVYEGMIIGQNSKENDLVVNITKEKQLTNVRASGADENIILTPPRTFSLEEAIDFIEEDELIEVTPKSIRLRKKELAEGDRKRKK